MKKKLFVNSIVRALSTIIGATILMLLSVLLMMSWGHIAWAKSKKAHHKQIAKVSAQKSENKRLKTEHDFEDQLVNGKYQYPDEAVATVEDEKDLEDLLDVRKDFKDRMRQSSLRH